MKNETHAPLRILMVAAEATPLAKVGGLADVVGALPLALRRLGHEVRLAIPHYAAIAQTGLRPIATEVETVTDPILRSLDVEPTISAVDIGDGFMAYLIGLDRWFGNSHRSEDIYASDPAAYVAFCRAASILATGNVHGQQCGDGTLTDWVPDVVHSHDWHAGLVPPYLRVYASGKRPATIHTVHNLAYAGVFGRDTFEMSGFPYDMYTLDGMEYYGGFSFLKAGMVYADIANTVSPQYAREVETEEYGGGMAGLVRFLRESGRFVGILNGIDTDVHDPARDPALPAQYSAADPAAKAVCKAALQADCGLTPEPRTPVVGMVSRICDQKGHDLVAACADGLAAAGCQLVILGVGDQAMEASLISASKRHPGRIAVRIGYDAYLAPRIYAGSDMFLMPSRFEPCGLGQLIALRYGSIPIVRRTGGLADTIRDIGERPRVGNGFVFDEMTPEALLGAVTRACGMYANKERWARLMARGMREDHGWDEAAVRYESLYRLALRARDSG